MPTNIISISKIKAYTIIDDSINIALNKPVLSVGQSSINLENATNENEVNIETNLYEQARVVGFPNIPATLTVDLEESYDLDHIVLNVGPDSTVMNGSMINFYDLNKKFLYQRKLPDQIPNQIYILNIIKNMNTNCIDWTFGKNGLFPRNILKNGIYN